MKKTIAFIALLLTTMSVSAQFYVSLSGGRTIAANEQVLGQNTSTFFTTTTTTGQSTYSSDLKGSYGEGLTGQLRIGYFFNETIGLELGGGYLHGFLQNVNKGVVVIPGEEVSEIENFDQWARGRAFGASLSLVANVTKNFYVRAGLLTKVGGYTELTTNIDLSATELGELGTAQIVNEFEGKLPLGFIGALGYRFKLTEKLNLFAEIEYMNINVKRDISNLVSFESSLDATTLAFLASQDESLEALLSEEEVQWGENGLSAPKAPYSSVGANLGLTYSF